MPHAEVDYDAPDLARRIEQLSQFDLDNLPFGVILLDAEGIIQFYSDTEVIQSGYGSKPLGQNFFTISRCAGKNDFHGQIVRAQEEGKVDLEFALTGDFGDPGRELRVRVQSSRSGGVWIFMQRDEA